MAPATRLPAELRTVNEALARKYFPGESVVGRHVRYGSDPGSPWLRIVGVVASQKTTNVNQEMNW